MTSLGAQEIALLVIAALGICAAVWLVWQISVLPDVDSRSRSVAVALAVLTGILGIGLLALCLYFLVGRSWLVRPRRADRRGPGLP